MGVKKGETPLLWWCGPCWIDDERVFAVKKIGNLPCCKAHAAALKDNPSEVKRLFAQWDAMPNIDDRGTAMIHFENFLKKATKECF
jgi:hypothetical protein